MVGCWVEGTIVPPFDSPLSYFDELGILVRQWLNDFDIGHFKLYITELLY